ncbi:YhcG family protein [Geothrix sp. 21YS21S-2]|uniref:PDDEXK nuclease domain-containing protein n=1 Tax=Geothrix sp. 21YS21S-2 TaxID=3068893 RepID=UPI0027B9F9AF|nr:PDDEXK nuclease domain-containing protein [Geothrix sp. 21YS21S-2]
MNIDPLGYNDVQAGITALVESARSTAARSVNALMTATYWEIGRRIVHFEQGGREQAAYGETLIKRLAADLTKRFTLPWSAYVRLLSVNDLSERMFYESEALRGGWSVRQLDRQIESRFYERTSRADSKAIPLDSGIPGTGNPSPHEAIKDPFVLEFLNLKDEYSKSELEEALIQHLAEFLLEMGDDFAFVGRQRRLRLDDTWFRVDLLFFHRKLKALVVIDIKDSRFSHADAGQMHMYLNYVRGHGMREGENPPVGLILCTGKGAEEAHYALDNLPSTILAARYPAELPDEGRLVKELEPTRLALETRPRPPPPRGSGRRSALLPGDSHQP